MAENPDSKVRRGPHGIARWLLKLLVEIDSSRFIGTRLGAALGLLTLLGVFVAAGYWLPALLSHYLHR